MVAGTQRKGALPLDPCSNKCKQWELAIPSQRICKIQWPSVHSMATYIESVKKVIFRLLVLHK